jgi:hypothetical protein
MATVNQHEAMSNTQTGGKIQKIPVNDSSFLQEFVYDSGNLTLTVTMKDGGTYTHYFIFPVVVQQLIESPSKGSFYAKNIKGKGPSQRIISKTVGRKPSTQTNKKHRENTNGKR